MRSKKLFLFWSGLTLALVASFVYFKTLAPLQSAIGPAGLFPEVKNKFVIVGNPDSNDFRVDIPPKGDFRLVGDFSDLSQTDANPPPKHVDVVVFTSLIVRTLHDQNGDYINIDVNAGGPPGHPEQQWFRRTSGNFALFSNWGQIKPSILAANDLVEHPESWFVKNQAMIVSYGTLLAAMMTALAALLTAFSNKKPPSWQ